MAWCFRRQLPNSAASLARSAFRSNATCARTNHLVAAAHRTCDLHKDAAKRDQYPVRMAAAISGLSRSGGIIRRMVGDHVNQFFLAGARQISYRPIQSFLLDLNNFLERQVRLRPVRRGRLPVAFDELAPQPAKNVISNAGGMTNVRVFREAARLKSL